ncbi:NF-kappa-B inhibitor zeta-like isoform X2 [Salvelinus fontinalis]|uniref:NF-kappa-B inhibitor zeta-like isoform X2 n=1 Tax=Salvelinus fontinalis TaxID=8038 RepID=UPI0024859530|nr:NF-kappa-B inhibitor zeta-like isoform X2 [Salvelinus fontinalis]
MIIDRIIENGLNLVHPGTVVTSPVYLGSFYQDTSPATEINNSLCAPNELDGWGNFRSPTPPTADRATNECSMSEVQSFGRFQGVRVKNTVKDLIMQKRLSNQNVQQHSEGEYTGHKRTVDFSLITDSPAKRLATAKAILTLSPPEGSTLDIDFMELGYESMKSETSPQETLPDPFSLIDYQSIYPQTHMPHAMGNSYVPQPFIAPLTPKGVWPLAQFADGEPMSFFQWQIQQEAEKLAGLTPEMLTSQDNDGDTFLHITVAQGRRALAYVLASKMATVGMLDMKEHNGQSALQLSVAANQHLIVQDLLAQGAQINTTDCWGRSPLHVCAEKGHALTLQTIQRALKSKRQELNVEEVNYDGLTPLQTAVRSHNAVVQELGRMAATPQSPEVVELIQRRKLLGQCVNTLLLMGASCATKDHKSGRTSLHMASQEANVELLRIFLDQPDSLSIVNVKSFSGNTALHFASSVHGRVTQVDAVKLLMRRGADPSSKNLENEQPAQLVAEGPVGDQVRRILKGKGYQARSAAQ